MADSIWFVIPTNRETAFRAAYLGENIRGVDNLNEAEKIGVMLPNNDDTKLMTGSSRITLAAADRLRLANPSWVEIFTTFPPRSEWQPKRTV